MGARFAHLQRAAGNRAVASSVALQRACGCGGGCCDKKEEGQDDSSGASQVQRLTADEKLVDLTSPQLAGDDRLQKAFDNAPALASGNGPVDTIKRFQQGLMDAGFAMPKSTTASGPDGKWGGETTKATKDFQTKHGLSPDGAAGRATLGAMDAMYNANAALPAKTPAAGLQIVGKRPGDKTGSRIFFEKDSAVLASDEDDTITALNTPLDRKVKLTGLRSEDEAPGLAGDRANAVAAAFGKAKHAGDVKTEPKADAGVGQISYRQVRAVEVTTQGAKPAVPDCSAGADVDCGADPTSPFATGHKRAMEMLSACLTALAAPDPTTLALVAKVFGTPSAAAQLRVNLGKIEAHLKEMPDKAHHRCHNGCDTVCADATAYNQGLDAGAMMTLCPDYQALADVDERGALLIHEGSHGTGGLNGKGGTDDKAYNFQRIVNFLSSSDALANADSYAIFVRNLVKPGSMDMGPSKPDTFTGLTPAEGTDVERSIAFAEKWFDGDENGTGSAYGGAKDAKKAGVWNDAGGEANTKAIAARLPITKPPAVPTDADIFAIAAVNERFHGLFRSLGRPVAVTKQATGEERWDLKGSTFTVTDGFFLLSKRRQLDLVIAKMVEAHPQIRPEQQAGFTALADDLRQLDGVAAP